MTSSADTSGVEALGRFDVAQMKVFRAMAEDHVKMALQAAKAQSLSASADPSQFVTDEMIGEFLNQASVSWDEATGLVYALAGDLPVPIYTSVINRAIRTASNEYRDLISLLTGKNAYGALREPIYGEFLKGNLVQFGDVRPMLVTLGGGSPDPTVPLVGGIATGNTMGEWMSSNGLGASKRIWLYGDMNRRVFNGHLQMDGIVFKDWQDDGLRIAPQDAWLRRTHYQVGDHTGCACIVAPYIPNFSDPYELKFS